MPELPEVEIVRRGLEALLVGRRFERVVCHRPDLRFPFPDRFAARLEGQSVTAVERRAKYLIARLSSCEVLVMHLGMTGRFTGCTGPYPLPRTSSDGVRPLKSTVSARAPRPNVRGATPSPAPVTLAPYIYDTGHDPAHDHVVFAMSGGAAVTYNDPRRFGFMLLIPESELDAHPLFAHLGVEPLGEALDAAHLARRAVGRRGDLKAFLMDQRIVAGLGNIYVCEALFRAGLSPRRRSGSLSRRGGRPHERAMRLVRAIRKVLTAAIEAGGSTLRDYRHADGAKGSFQEEFLVYGREGGPCRRPGCTGAIRRIVQSGRSTFYCTRCQT